MGEEPTVFLYKLLTPIRAHLVTLRIQDILLVKHSVIATSVPTRHQLYEMGQSVGKSLRYVVHTPHSTVNVTEGNRNVYYVHTVNGIRHTTNSHMEGGVGQFLFS